ncbi:MAG: M23 family metallopeptidase [Deltaproteobacteria bacterium]|nr:M23 family metallopeptidase [Deltaproteobacteria bacterium]
MTIKPSLFFTLIALLFLNQSCAVTAETNSTDSNNDSNTDIFSRTDIDGDLKLLLPFPYNQSYTITQGYNGAVTHFGQWSANALDFNLAEGDPILAVADGRVILVKEDSSVGGALDDQYLDDTNYILIDHGYGYFAGYYHSCFECVTVNAGDPVNQGDVIGYAGNTGYSDFPHLHFQMNTWSGSTSVPYGFYDVPDEGGFALEGETYTSKNNGASSVAYVESTIPADAFLTEHGITLNNTLPWYFSAGDTLTASGNVNNSKPWVALLLLNTDGSWITSVSTETVDGSFTLNLTVPSDLGGNYLLGMATADTDYYYTNWAPYVFIKTD